LFYINEIDGSIGCGKAGSAGVSPALEHPEGAPGSFGLLRTGRPRSQGDLATPKKFESPGAAIRAEEVDQEPGVRC